MVVEVKISASLRYYVRFPERYLKGGTLEMTEGATVGQALEALHFPGQTTSFVIVNGAAVDRERILEDGDEMHVLAPLSGG